MLSFNNDVALKQQILDHLNQLPVDETIWNLNAIAWDGTAGSFVGHMIKSEDLSDWESLGLPKWLALTLDYFLITSLDLKKGISANIELINAIPVGKDIENIGSQFLIELIMHDDVGIQKTTQNEQLLNALHSIVEIQKQCLANEDIVPATWRILRKAMVENSQTFEEDSLEYLISTFAEAAAWNPENSRTVVSDSVRIWGRVKLKANPEPDWTQERDKSFRALLKQIFDEAKAKQPEGSNEFINVFDILKVTHPEEFEWMTRQDKWSRVQPAVYGKKSAELLNKLLLQA